MHPDIAENEFDNMYPSFYSFVSNRVVCFWRGSHENYLGFSDKSKIVYKKIIESYLEPLGSASRKVLNLNATVIYYLQNRFTGEYKKPVVVQKIL